MDRGGGKVVLLKEIIKQMETFAPSHLAEEWDNVGLTIGNKNNQIKKILVALDVIPEVIEEAIQIGANLIVTHHPMILFQKIKNIQADTALGKKIYALIQNNISAYCAHTNLDIAFGGTNDVLAKIAGLENIKILQETSHEDLKKIVVYVPQGYEENVQQAMCDAGAGFIGNYSHCSFAAEGIGTFLPLEGTNPFLGKQNTLERTKEVRLETIVPQSFCSVVLEAMKKAHPYEEPAYDVYTVEQKGKCYGIGRIGILKESMTFEEYSIFLKKQLSLDKIRIVGEKKVSFIKMDVEGSEMNALIGASKTIRRDHPRLAICIYHKEIDFIKLSSYILQLYPEYKLYIRHYTSYIWETVLYAIDEQE